MSESLTKAKAEYIEVLNEQAKRTARNKLLAFTCYTKDDYEVANHNRVYASILDDFISGDIKRLMVQMPPQHGKEISHDTPILTPNGWTTHGQIKPGDYVFGRNGQPVKVLAESKEYKSEYLITFTDGSQIECHGNHEWVVCDRKRNGHGKEFQYETKWMYEQGVWIGEQGNRGSRARFQVDPNVSVEFPNSDLLVNPYVLGAYLGDGTADTNVITHHKDDTGVINEISKHYKLKFTKPLKPNPDTCRSVFKGLRDDLKQIGVHKDKFIPSDYLISSKNQRLELLAGLIDTDGYSYHKNGRVTFTNINKRLIEDVRKLVVSLGWRVTICEFEPVTSTSGIVGKNKVYQLCFNPDEPIPNRIERKRLDNPNPQIRKRAIKSIEKRSDLGVGKCIQVEGGIYLVGDSLIPTHNSELCTRRMPAKMLGDNPNRRIAVVAYNHTFAAKFNRDVQRIIDCAEYKELYPETGLNTKNIRSDASGSWLRNSDEFEIVGKQGSLISVGIGGGLTGNKVDVAIVDDPYKDAASANSEATRRNIEEWWDSVLMTRLHNNSQICLTFTRWRHDDIAGYLLEREPDKWVVVKFEAIKETFDNPYDTRELGEPLWPERHSLEGLLEKKEANPRIFNAMYQQNPTDKEGNKVKESFFEYYYKHELGNGSDFMYVDTATSEKELKDNDPSGILTGRMVGNRLYLTDFRKGLWDITDLPKNIEAAAAQNLTHRGRIFIENKSNGRSTKQILQRDTRLNVFLENPRGTKMERLENELPDLEAHKVFLPHGEAWVADFLEQLKGFPYRSHDEEVDCLTGLMRVSLKNAGKQRGIRRTN